MVSDTIHWRRILIVDNNVDFADSLGQFLQMPGNEVRAAHDSLRAICAGRSRRNNVY